jgi:hypothetical protein
VGGDYVGGPGVAWELGKANSADVATSMLKLRGVVVDEPGRAELTAKVTGLLTGKVASGQASTSVSRCSAKSRADELV